MENIVKKIDLTSLRLFVAVCQEHSIARAAAREFITPSAVSRRIAEIEAVVGLPIITRHHRGISVTPVGEVVLKHAKEVLASLESLGAELSSYYSGVRGTIKICANLSSVVQFLPEDISSFKRIFPLVRIELEERHTLEVLDIVSRGEAELGICNDVDDCGALVKLKYRKDRLSVIMSNQHAKAAAESLYFDSMLNEPFVVLRGDSALTSLLEGKSIEAKVPLNEAIRVGSLEGVCRMVDAGLGVAVVPHLVGEWYVDTLNVAVVPLQDSWATRQQIVVHGNSPVSASAHKLVEFLTEGGSTYKV